MDFLHLVLLLQSILPLLHFAFFFLLLTGKGIFLALVVRLLIALLGLLFVLLGLVLATTLLGCPVLNGEFVLLLGWPKALAPDDVPVGQDVSEHVLFLLLVGPPNLRLVVVNVVLNFLLLLLTLNLLFITFFLSIISGFLFLFILLPFFFLLIKLSLLLSPFL